MPVFVDTNVFVYARDASESAKQPMADRWLRYLWTHGEGRVSVQVLQEYYAVVTRKLRPGMPPAQARSDVRDLLAWRPTEVDAALLEVAWMTQDRYGISFWDSLIVAAAHEAGCETLLTEDFTTGMELDGLAVVSPFTSEPPSVSTEP